MSTLLSESWLVNCAHVSIMWSLILWEYSFTQQCIINSIRCFCILIGYWEYHLSSNAIYVCQQILPEVYNEHRWTYMVCNDVVEHTSWPHRNISLALEYSIVCLHVSLLIHSRHTIKQTLYLHWYNVVLLLSKHDIALGFTSTLYQFSQCTKNDISHSIM